MNNTNIIQTNIHEQLSGWLDRLPHALLLHGAMGIGKLELAESFGRFLLCEAPEASVTACARCNACRWALAGNHPDLRIVEPEALGRAAPVEEEGKDPEEGGRPRRKPSLEIRIEQMRELTEFLQLGSHRAGRKVAIVHPAEAMNTAAANALLKSLEEPPAGSFLILVSHRPARLAATIRSRCVQFSVPIPDPAAAIHWLEAKGIRNAGDWLAFAGGAPRRAEALASGELGVQIQQWRSALEAGSPDVLLGVREREEVETLVDVLQRYAVDRAMAAFGQVPKYGHKAASAANAGQARQWLAYARSLCRHRGLARHPLNPRLFVADMLSALPAPR